MDITITVEHSYGDEVFHWCQENCKGKWRFNGAITSYNLNTGHNASTDLLYIFEDEDDLMLVRLVWGGQVRRIQKR